MNHTDISIEHFKTQIGGTVLFENIPSLKNVLSSFFHMSDKNLFFSDFDLADKEDLIRVSPMKLLGKGLNRLVFGNGFRVDFFHKNFGSLVFSVMAMEDNKIMLKFHAGMDLREQCILSFLMHFAQEVFCQLYASHDFDILIQNCDDPSLFEACEIQIPDTAVRNDLVLGKKIIPRLDISKNPGLEVYNSKGFLHVAGWFNLIQKDVVPLIFNCAEDYIFSVFPGASRVGPNGGFLMVRAQVPILEVSSEFGRGFQRRFLGVLRP